MKYCPACRERFDEEIIKFCTRDGTPLVEEDPRFSELPSEVGADQDEEIGQETVIRRRPVLSDEEPTLRYDTAGSSERIVIPTSQQERPNVRARSAQGFVVPPPPPNTAKTVVLTIIGTLAVLGVGAGLFWFLQKDTPANANININANQNTNLNTNLGFDSNFNFNVNSIPNLNTNFNVNTNVNTNMNANTRPSPTPSPRLSPSPTPVRVPSPTPEETATPRPVNTRPANSQPTPVGTPRIGPRPPPLSNRPGNANK